jgi:hypothetical protein
MRPCQTRALLYIAVKDNNARSTIAVTGHHTSCLGAEHKQKPFVIVSAETVLPPL